MAIADDVSFDTINKIVSRSGSPSSTVYSVNALYSYVMDYFDELGLMDDTVPMSAQTPTSYTMISGWYIQEELTEFLDGGAIQTSGYLDEIHVLTLDGTYTNAVAGDIGKQVKDDAAEIGALLDFNNTSQKWFIRVGSSTVIADNSVMAITAGTGAGDASGDSVTGEAVFANPYTLGALEGTPAIYIYQNGSPITSWWSDGPFDILLKVAEGGSDIDSKTITVTTRTWTDTYSTFEITLTTAGQNAVPLGTQDDLNNTNTEADVQDWAAANIGGDGTTYQIDIDFEFSSPFQYDIGDGNGAQDYNVQIDCNGQTLDKVYEVCKWATRDGATGEKLETESDGNTINGEAYRYAKASYAEVTASPLGTFAGGKFFGARGVYFTNLHGDDAQNFQLIDANGVARFPPNYQAFTVGGVESGDRVAVFLAEAGAVKKDQYSLNGANALNTITVSSSIPADTPTTGTIIVVDDDSSETSYAYSSYSGSDFTVSISASVYSGTETAYVPYILEQASGTSVSETTTIYVSDRSVICRVRKKGILPFVTTGNYTSTGYAATAIRTTDGIVT